MNNKKIEGYADIHAVISNERKIGGAIEAHRIKLRTGEEYKNPVITNIDYCGGVFYCLCLTLEDGETTMIHVNDISRIDSPTHKRICDVKNKSFRLEKTKQKLKYLKKLCEVNKGSLNEIFLHEARMLVKDIGMDQIQHEIDLGFLNEKAKIFKIA